MRSRCRPHIDPRPIFFSVIAAIEAAGLKPGEASGAQLIVLSFAIHKLKQKLEDAEMADRLEQMAHEAGSELGLSPEAVSQLMGAA